MNIFSKNDKKVVQTKNVNLRKLFVTWSIARFKENLSLIYLDENMNKCT